MKISYGITVHNEAKELKRLLEVLHKSIDDCDEVVVCVDGNDDAVKFEFTSGNIESGVIKMYGVL